MRRPSPSLAIALLALLISLGGTAIAARHLVSGDSLIKKGSLSGNRLRKRTLTGVQIDVSKLGQVPSAHTADLATSAASAQTATNATHASTADTAIALPALRWTPLTLIHGWLDYNGPGESRVPAVAVDAQGIVHLRGAIKNSAGSIANTNFATIPAQFLPSSPAFVETTMLNEATGRIEVFSDGTMYALPTSGDEATAAGFTSLDGLTYALG